MSKYARIDSGRVVEIISPLFYDSGEEINISDRFTPEFVLTLVNVTDVTPGPIEGMTYDGSSFAEYVEPVPTPQELLISNGAIRDALLSSAYVYIAPLQLSIALGDASDDETTEAKAWQAYTRALKALDLSVQDVSWPVAPSYA